MQMPATERAGYVRRMVRDNWEIFSIPIRRDLKDHIYRWCRMPKIPLPTVLRDPNVVTYAWLQNYEPHPYNGEITLVRPGDIAMPPDSDKNCGWRGLTTGRISTHSVPGDRSTMFLGPNLTLLAGLLRGLMNAER